MIKSAWRQWQQRRKVYVRAFTCPDYLALKVALWHRNSQLKDIAFEASKHVKSGMVLDVGTGPGGLPTLIVAKNSNVHCVGIDLEILLLQESYKDALNKSLNDRTSFVAANARSLPFANQTFDLVVSSYSIHQWQDRKACVAEIYRTLEYEGIFLIWVGRYKVLTGYSRYFDLITKKSKKYFTELLREAGFKEIRITYEGDEILRAFCRK